MGHGLPTSLLTREGKSPSSGEKPTSLSASFVMTEKEIVLSEELTREYLDVFNNRFWNESGCVPEYIGSFQTNIKGDPI